MAKKATTTTEPTAKDVRAWAKGQGLEVGDRGIIAADVWEQYRAAHK